MSKAKPLPERGFLLECFSMASAKVGVLKWRERPRRHFKTTPAWKTWNSNFAGKLAGSVNSSGYLIASIDRMHFAAHRIIFKMNGGDDPEVVDHIDGIKMNNSPSNLRAATNLQNAQNKDPRKTKNATGFMGVSECPQVGRFEAKIRVDGKTVRIGVFSDAESAHNAYIAASKNVRGEFSGAKSRVENGSSRRNIQRFMEFRQKALDARNATGA